MKVKPEPGTNNDFQVVPREELIDIYVGAQNQKFICPRVDVLKSAALTSYIKEDPPHIMHPSLTDVDPDDFGVLVEYLKLQEYRPLLINGRLEGIRSEVEHAIELRRCGRLYLLAERFQIKDMMALVVKKVQQGMPKKKDPTAVMDLAEMVFTRPMIEAHVQAPSIPIPSYTSQSPSTPAAMTVTNKGTDVPPFSSLRAQPMALPLTKQPIHHDPMEDFLITLIAVNLKPLTIQPRTAKMFWDLEEKQEARRRDFGKRVFECKIEMWSCFRNGMTGAHGGESVKIEDKD